VLTDGAPKPYQVVDTWPGAVGEVEYRLTLFDPIDPGDVQILATFVFEVEPRTPTPTETEPPTVAPSATPVPAASGTTLPTSSPTPLAGETQGAPRSPQPTASPGPAATASQPDRTATARPTASGPRTPSPAILAVDSAGGSGLQAASASAATRLPTAPRLLVTVAGIAVVLAALCAVAGFVVWRRT
jgi:hypothetical protein